MKEKKWYIIYTNGIGSKGILQVQSLLDRLGYDGMTWVPTKKSSITRYGKTVPNNKPIFSSYIFIKTYTEDSQLEQALIEAKIGKFLKYPGDDRPAEISKEDIDLVKSLEENVFGEEEIPEKIVTVEKGNLVEICVGPMIGFKGIITQVIGHEAYVETLVFGRSALVRINVFHLLKVLDKSEE